jgi:hypothetical protein
LGKVKATEEMLPAGVERSWLGEELLVERFERSGLGVGEEGEIVHAVVRAIKRLAVKGILTRFVKAHPLLNQMTSKAFQKAKKMPFFTAVEKKGQR